MTMKEYVQKNGTLMNYIKSKSMTIYDRIMNSNFLPADDIREVDGQLKKVIYIDKDNDIVWALDDFLWMTDDEVQKLDMEYQEAFYNYVALIDRTDLDVKDIINQLKEFREKWSK